MNNELKKWRFPGNNYTEERGIDTPDMETFAKDPIASLARETCQNSIDARIEGKTAKIQFKTFDIMKEDIPGVDRIEKEIDSCMEYKQNNTKISENLRRMKEQLNAESIHCIRISDYNTKGLAGVSKTDDSPFFLLTKGTGISDKSGSKGGSKGIGKFATFVASSFNTVFYSTLNLDGERGYIGICKLCSTRMENTDEKTIGIGYFGANEKNMPILENFSLEKNYIRETSGTDIYILGFRKNENWEKELITKILDSFMCAIYFENLEVEIDELVINKTSLNNIIDDVNLIDKRRYNNIKSQYILLNDSDVFRDELEIDEYGKVDIYLKPFSKEKSDLATNECVMIRYPYMKIKSLSKISNVPCSAMCIIGDNKLNAVLRDIENPQHTDWEVNRIDDDDLKSEVRYIIGQLKNKILDFVCQKLSNSDVKETDVEGASEFLPGVEESDIGFGEETLIAERPKIVKKVKNKIKDKIGIEKFDDGNALTPSLGEHTEEGEGSPVPFGTNNSSSGDPHNGEQETGYKSDEEGNDIMTLVQMKGMHYRVFVTNKKTGEFVISFKSLYTEENCELEIKYFDDSNTKYNIDVNRCMVNGIPHEIKNGRVVKIKLVEGNNYKIKLLTGLRDLYAFEVKMYANR